MLLMTDEALKNVARFCYDNNVMCAMHAIGDRAIDQALEVLADFPKDAACFRIEHCELVGPAQLDAIKNSPVLLALQPNFVRNWAHHADLYEERLGKKRLEFCNPYRTLRQSNVPYVFGSDGMPPGPLYGMKGATGHPVESERLTAGEAIDDYTDGPSRFGLHVREAGRLQPGKLADYVVLSGDPLTQDLDTIEVARTAVCGQAVFDRLEAT